MITTPHMDRPALDPQADVDRLIEHIRETRLQGSALALRTFQDFARAARGTAIKHRINGDLFCESLATARAEVYEKAAEMVTKLPRAEAAAQMMTEAKNAYIRTPPLINYDWAGVQYIKARAWQYCAWKIDPSLPEVQPSWD